MGFEFLAGRMFRNRSGLSCSKPTYLLAAMSAIGLCAWFWPDHEIMAQAWSEISAPAPGSPRSIGLTSNGCIAGAATLPLQGTGYSVMHVERHRYFGHPQLVQTIQSLGREVVRQGLGHLLVGDLGQARGGPMPSGHRSHQTGLDADVWYVLDEDFLRRTAARRSELSAPSMLGPFKRGLDRSLWGGEQVRVLEFTSRLNQVDRIFVNPHIKLDLCNRVRGDRDWLNKIRPWYGHDDHFHLRLSCQPGSPDCDSQDPVPPGNGCDASLDWWLEQPLPPSKPQPVPILPMPPACRALLSLP
jgi:penicillin-insensitive murein DD-endopeptidase